MTAAQLFAYITAALLLQVLAGAAFAVWRRTPIAAAQAPSSVEDVHAAAGVPSAAWAGWRDFRVLRREFEDTALTQCSFHLQAVDGRPLEAFLPGQYLSFLLKLPDGRQGSPAGAGTITRCYSLSDRPDAASFRITVKRVPPSAAQPDLPPGLASSHFHDRVQVGDVLQVKAPAGRFFIDQDASVPAVFIAGGIGITPMMSMLRWCVAMQPERPLHLYYGVRDSSDHAFKRVLEDLAAAQPLLSLHVLYGTPKAGDVLARDYQHLGFVDLALLRRTLPHGRHSFYVCGPPPMMQSLVPALRAWGVQPDDIHVEAFGPASVRPTGPVSNEPASARSTSFEVRFRRAGRSLSWDGRDANLLDFAERHGLAVDSGCRSGSCGSCQTRLLSGVVGYADKPDHDIAGGHCLLCVSKPRSALVLDA